MLDITAARAAIRTPAPMWMCGARPPPPPIWTPSPRTALPAMPVWPLIMHMRPIWTLCAIWQRLSILLPAPMRVAPNLPRSMQVQEPISTSSSSTTFPRCGTRSTDRPSGLAR